MEMNSEMIWKAFSKELKRFVLSKVKDKDTSEDILQDVFIKLHTRKDTIRDEAKIKSWLYQTTRNIIVDYFRKKKFSVSTDELEIPLENEVTRLNEQFSKCVQPHINKLPPKYKEALTKTELQNYSQLQLAEELNISYSGAKSRVQRARELLKRYFMQCCDVSSDKYGNILAFTGKHDCELCN